MSLQKIGTPQQVSLDKMIGPRFVAEHLCFQLNKALVLLAEVNDECVELRREVDKHKAHPHLP